MDRYFNKPVHKKEFEFTKLGPSVCVLGRSGLGKTWTVHNALDPCVEITSDILKSKQATLEFLEKIRGTSIPIIIDEYECIHDLVGLKEITAPPTSGLFVVISQVPVKFDFEIKVYDFPVPTFEQVKKIVPAASDEAILKANGDLRAVFQSLEFKSDDRDLFPGTKEFISNIVSKNKNENPCAYIGAPLSEPGNIAAIIQANYIDSTGRLELISEQLSMADVLDSRVYAGDWNMLPYFNLFGCILPAYEINHSLGDELRPGETWTKYQNMCMRSKRIASMSNKVPHCHLDLGALLLIRDYIEKDYDEAVRLMREYGFTPQDVDVLNHVSPYRKIKAKTLSTIKKCLKELASIA
jgi:hypothetical protein